MPYCTPSDLLCAYLDDKYEGIEFVLVYTAASMLITVGVVMAATALAVLVRACVEHDSAPVIVHL